MYPARLRVWKWIPVGMVLLSLPTSPQPQDEPAPRERLEIGSHFCSQGRIAVRLTEHERSYTELRKFSGKIAQGTQALMRCGFSQLQVIFDPQRGEARRQLSNQAAIVLEELDPWKAYGKRLKHETEFDSRHRRTLLLGARRTMVPCPGAQPALASVRPLGLMHPQGSGWLHRALWGEREYRRLCSGKCPAA